MAEKTRVEALELEERLLGSQPTETSDVPTTSNEAKEASETAETNVEEGNCCLSPSCCEISPTVSYWCNFVLAWTINVILTAIDEITDIISAVFHFIRGDHVFGAMTLLIPIAPAAGAAIINRKGNDEDSWFKTFLKHWPIVQLWTHQIKVRKITNLQKKVKDYRLVINYCKGQSQTPENLTKIERYEGIIVGNENKINDIQTSLQRFKIYNAMLESAPQFILQFSIKFKQLYNGDDLFQGNEYISKEWMFVIFLFQTSTSVLSVFTTVSGLLSAMPVYVHTTERPPNRSCSFTYGKMLPMAVFSVTPKLMTLIVIGSFVTLQDVSFYIPAGLVYIVTYFISCCVIKRWILSLKKHPEFKSKTSLIYVGLVTSFVAPCVIGIYNSSFLFATSFTSSAIHSLALGTLCVIANIQPDLVFNSTENSINQTNFINKDLEEEGLSHLYWLNMFTIVLIPSLLIISNLFVYLIQKYFMENNSILGFVRAVDTNNADFFEQNMKETKKHLSIRVPGDKNNHTLLQYTYQTNEELSIRMIDKSLRLNLSLSETFEMKRTPLILACALEKPKIANAILCQAKEQDIAINAKNIYGFTAFILACANGLTDIVAMMLEMAQEVNIDLNEKSDFDKKTGFIWACYYRHSEVIDLIMAKAESLQIDLQCKDKYGESGFDHFPEYFQK